MCSQELDTVQLGAIGMLQRRPFKQISLTSAVKVLRIEKLYKLPATLKSKFLRNSWPLK